MATYKSAMKTN